MILKQGLSACETLANLLSKKRKEILLMFKSRASLLETLNCIRINSVC